MNGAVQLFHDRPIPGPYTQAAREDWLRRLLEAQEHVRAQGPAAVRGIELITVAELEEIRRLWVVDKHEFEDRLPAVYEQATGRAYSGRGLGGRLHDPQARRRGRRPQALPTFSTAVAGQTTDPVYAAACARAALLDEATAAQTASSTAFPPCARAPRPGCWAGKGHGAMADADGVSFCKDLPPRVTTRHGSLGSPRQS
jgi:hypothetical protein